MSTPVRATFALALLALVGVASPAEAGRERRAGTRAVTSDGIQKRRVSKTSIINRVQAGRSRGAVHGASPHVRPPKQVSARAERAERRAGARPAAIVDAPRSVSSRPRRHRSDWRRQLTAATVPFDGGNPENQIADLDGKPTPIPDGRVLRIVAPGARPSSTAAR